jgi:hypothetical protein
MAYNATLTLFQLGIQDTDDWIDIYFSNVRMLTLQLIVFNHKHSTKVVLSSEFFLSYNVVSSTPRMSGVWGCCGV